VHLMNLLTPERNGELTLDFEDAVQRGMTVTNEGEILWPPPPVAVSAAPAPVAAVSEEELAERARLAQAAAARRRTRRSVLTIVGALLGAALLTVAPADTRGHLTIFALAVVI